MPDRKAIIPSDIGVRLDPQLIQQLVQNPPHKLFHARSDYRDRIIDVGDTIPPDEPVILFRAQDRFFLTVLQYYAKLLTQNENVDPQIPAAIQQHYLAAREWQAANPDKVKEPDIQAGNLPAVER